MVGTDVDAIIEHVACAGDRGVLAAIRDPSVDLAIWRRTLSFDSAPLLDGSLQDVCFVAGVGEVAHALPGHLSNAGFPSGPICDALSQDIGDLVGLFAALVSFDRFEIRLDHVTTNACWKFHADYVEARLLVTYAGPGTQWLARRDAARVRAGEAPTHIEQIAEGDVAILKGRLGSIDHPTYHRSPPIEGTGVRRLLLAVSSPPTAVQGDT
jgi:hypothetical protein